MGLKYSKQPLHIIRSFYVGMGKTAVIYPSAFLVALGIGVVNLGFIFYIREVFNATPSQVGFFSALWSLCYITGCILIRPLFNRVIPRFLLIGSAFTMGLLVFSILFLKNLSIIPLFYGLYGLVLSFFWPPLMGWLSRDADGPTLGRILSRYNFSWSLGVIVSPLLAGILSDVLPELPIYFGSFILGLTGLLMTGASVTLPKIRNDAGFDISNSENSNGNGEGTPMRFPAWVGAYTTFVVIGVIVNIFPVYARDELFLSKKVIGSLLQSRAFSITLGFILMGSTTFWHFRVSQMIAGQFILVVFVFLLTFASSPSLMALFIAMIGFLMSISYFNSLFHGISGSNNRTGRMAIHESILSAGLISGSTMGGIIYQHYSMKTVFYICAVIVLLGISFQWGLYLWFKNRGSLRVEKG